MADAVKPPAAAFVETEVKVVAKKGDGFPFRRYERDAELSHTKARKLIDFYEKLLAEPEAG